MPQAHRSQGHAVQGGQGVWVRTGQEALRQEAAGLWWSDEARVSQEGAGGSARPGPPLRPSSRSTAPPPFRVFAHSQAKTTKKVTLRLECKECKYKMQLPLKRTKHFEIGANKCVPFAPAPGGIVRAHRTGSAFVSPAGTSKLRRSFCCPRRRSLLQRARTHCIDDTRRLACVALRCATRRHLISDLPSWVDRSPLIISRAADVAVRLVSPRIALCLLLVVGRRSRCLRRASVGPAQERNGRLREQLQASIARRGSSIEPSSSSQCS